MTWYLQGEDNWGWISLCAGVTSEERKRLPDTDLEPSGYLTGMIPIFKDLNELLTRLGGYITESRNDAIINGKGELQERNNFFHILFRSDRNILVIRKSKWHLGKSSNIHQHLYWWRCKTWDIHLKWWGWLLTIFVLGL